MDSGACDKWGSATAAAHGPLSHALVRVNRAHRAVAAQLLRQFGLYPGQELMLLRLWEKDRQAQGELARVLGVDASTATKSVQRLEQGGFVVREPCPDDRRSVLIALTGNGREICEQLAKVWAELEDRTTAGLTAEESRTALGLVERMESNLCPEAHCPDTES